MKDSRKSIEQLSRKLDKEQIIARLKQLSLKGGNNGNGCPPPSWPPD